MVLRAGKYILADSGEKNVEIEAMAAMKMI